MSRTRPARLCATSRPTQVSRIPAGSSAGAASSAVPADSPYGTRWIGPVQASRLRMAASVDCDAVTH